MATFEEVLATVYPVASAILARLNFWDVFSLALTSHSVRNTLLNHTAAFRHCDLRDEYAVAVQGRAIACDRAALPLASKWGTHEEYINQFLAAAADANRSHPERGLKLPRLHQCLAVGVRELVLDGIRIDPVTLGHLLRTAEPSALLLSLTGVTGTSPTEFISLFTQFAWAALEKLHLWRFGGTDAVFPQIMESIAQAKNVQLDMVWQHSDTSPQVLLNHHCFCDLCGKLYSLIKPLEQTCQICASNYCPDCIGRHPRIREEGPIDRATQICPKCDELDTLLKCDSDGCTNGWLFQHDAVPPPQPPLAASDAPTPPGPPPKHCVYGRDHLPCHHCGRWLCAECTQETVELIVYCGNCWNATCSPCLLEIVAADFLAAIPTGGQPWPQPETIVHTVQLRQPRVSLHAMQQAWDRMLVALPTPPPTPTLCIPSPAQHVPAHQVPPRPVFDPTTPSLLPPLPPPSPPHPWPLAVTVGLVAQPPPQLAVALGLAAPVDVDTFNDGALALADALNYLRGRPYAPEEGLSMLEDCEGCEQGYLCNDCLGPPTAAAKVPPDGSTPPGWCGRCCRPHLFYSDEDAGRDGMMPASGSRSNDGGRGGGGGGDAGSGDDGCEEGEEEEDDDDDDDEDLEYWDGGEDEAMELHAELLGISSD